MASTWTEVPPQTPQASTGPGAAALPVAVDHGALRCMGMLHEAVQRRQAASDAPFAIGSAAIAEQATYHFCVTASSCA